MRVADLGEFALIDRLQQIVGSEDAPDVIVGIGDDCAVLTDRDDEYLLVTVDSHVEQVHFLPFLTTPRQLGRRALVVNLSDIAAMGGRPQFAVVALTLPDSTSVAWVEDFYRGMRAEADRYGVLIIGGNLTRSPGGAVADITLLGRVRRDRLLLRSGAQPGDALLVTDRLGDAYSGLRLVFDPRLPVELAVRQRLITRYMEPQARLAEAQAIAASGAATAMLDVSDGLAGDVAHICVRSQVGVQLYAEQLPVTPDLHAVAAALDTPFWQLALEGGDDYGLCFTARPDAVDDLRAQVQQASGSTVTVIGEVLPANAGRWLVRPDGHRLPLGQSWQHFGANDAPDQPQGA